MPIWKRWLIRPPHGSSNAPASNVVTSWRPSNPRSILSSTRRGPPAIQVEAACAGFIYALSIADKFIRLGEAKCALVIGAERVSKLVNWTDRNTCVLFCGGVYELFCHRPARLADWQRGGGISMPTAPGPSQACGVVLEPIRTALYLCAIKESRRSNRWLELGKM